MRSAARTLGVAATLALAMVLAGPAAQAQKSPAALRAADLVQLPYRMNGLVSSFGPKKGASGSGVVVKHPRVLLSAAHVLFAEGTLRPWRTDNRFYPRWHDSSFPPEDQGIPLAGFRFLTSYSRAAKKTGINSERSFASDVVAHYAYENLAGGFAGAWKKGTSVLGSDTARKIVVGYPSGRYSAGDGRRYKMHETGPFRMPFSRVRGRYMAVTGVEIGTGNSGGPVYVEDKDGSYLVAGIYVSFSDAAPSIGVRAVDGSVWKLVKKAIPDSEKPRVAFVDVPASADTRKVVIAGTATDDVMVDNVRYRLRREGRVVHGWKSAELAGPLRNRTWTATLKLKTLGRYQVEVRASDSRNNSPIETIAIERL